MKPVEAIWTCKGCGGSFTTVFPRGANKREIAATENQVCWRCGLYGRKYLCAECSQTVLHFADVTPVGPGGCYDRTCDNGCGKKTPVQLYDVTKRVRA